MTMTRADWRAAELAGLPGKQERSIYAPVDQEAWHVPDVLEIDGDRLVWRYTDSTRLDSLLVARPGGRMLGGFWRLARASPEQIRRYASQWGYLGICIHGKPSSGCRDGARDGCRPLGWDLDNSGWEPLELWRHYARRAAALIRIVTALHRGHVGQPADWRAACEWSAGVHVNQETGAASGDDGYVPALCGPQTVESDRHFVAGEVRAWLVLGDVRPAFWWDASTPVRRWRGYGLFGALAVQLMLATSRTCGLAQCSGCGTSYIPAKRPSATRRNFCDVCRETGVPQAMASHDYRHRDQNR